MSEDEIAIHQNQFEKLYQTWDTGEELEVENVLDQMPVEELRRFADANNLNVTSKLSKSDEANCRAFPRTSAIDEASFS